MKASKNINVTEAGMPATGYNVLQHFALRGAPILPCQVIRNTSRRKQTFMLA